MTSQGIEGSADLCTKSTEVASDKTLAVFHAAKKMFFFFLLTMTTQQQQQQQ